ncbi:hypothetical protein [Halegenticoccus tardaugens]|uniref:hypothetical protein n=1 Tax=Halegenticoccus tardaugens TaxID=2071624 RepID=UPI00100AE127|nr:hypothetical protein [Halegenticoccus tardaugens]
MAAPFVSAHEPSTAISDHGLGFGFVVALTVALGILGGVIVVRRRSSAESRPSTLSISILLVVLGCWAAIVAVLEGSAFAGMVMVAGAVATWSLRNHVFGGHRGCDQAALGAVVLHRFVEGALLAILYSAAATVGLGAALVLAAHTAAETGAVAGLWSTGKWKWGIIAIVQAGFVAGALGGELVAQFMTPLVSITALALLGGTLIASGVITASNRQRVPPGDLST